MTNVRVEQVDCARADGWVVRANTLRYGRQKVMYEGTYYQCIEYVTRQFNNPLVESIAFWIDGISNGEFWNNVPIRLHKDGRCEVLSYMMK